MPAKRNNLNVFAAVGAAVLGVAAGVAGMFFSKKENRNMVASQAKKAVRKGKAEVAKAKRKIAKVTKTSKKSKRGKKR